MALSEVGSVHDDQYLSDDSTLSSYSDLDYNLNVDVMLPNGSIKKTSIPAYTPWSDVRTHLCSHFKINPSNHVVDFISTSKSTKTRKASRPIGKMDISKICIKEKGHHTKTAAPAPPLRNVDKGTVRLIIRLPKSRQSILRVDPDVPLSTIFDTISNKLKLDEHGRESVEFRHPVHHEVRLNNDLTLNQYDLREVYLTQKNEYATASKSSDASFKPKRKAPPPPRPPPPNFSSRSKSTSSIENKPLKVQTEEPVYAQVQKKPKPKKRKSAPVPPQLPTSSELEVMTESEDLKTEIPEETKQDSDTCLDDPAQKEAPTFVDDSNIYATINDVAPIDRKEKVDDVVEQKELDKEENDDAFDEIDSSFQDESALQSIEKVLHTDGQTSSESEEEKDDDIAKSIDNALEQLEDITLTDDNGDEEESEEIIENGWKVKSDEVDANLKEEATPTEVEATQKEEPFDQKHEISSKSEKIPSETNAETETPKGITLAFNPTNSISSLKPDDDGTDSTAQKLVSFSTTTQLEDEEKNFPNDKNNDFDLHIAESFDIPLQSLDEKQSATKKSQSKPEVEEIPKESQPKKTNSSVQAKKDTRQVMEHVKSAQELENEKIAKEVEKLHKQIKMMKKRNSAKQMDTNGKGNSFKFVPAKKREASHDDYDVAPVDVIQLSNSGEIKALQKDKKTSDTAPVLHAEVTRKKKRNKKEKISFQEMERKTRALKHKNALPSYYKKFLGVRAFAAKESN